MNPNVVHSLWMGDKPPGLMEKLTVESFVRLGYTFYVWSYDPHSIAKHLPKAKAAFADAILPKHTQFITTQFLPSQKWQHFSDLFRMKLMLEFGEWWTDMDVTPMSRLPLSLGNAVMVNASHNEGYSLPLFRCPAGFEPLQRAYDLAKEILPDPKNKDWMASARFFREAMGPRLPDKILFTGMGCSPLLDILREKPDGTIPYEWNAIHWCNSGWGGGDKPKLGTVYQRLLKIHGIGESC